MLTFKRDKSLILILILILTKIVLGNIEAVEIEIMHDTSIVNVAIMKVVAIKKKKRSSE